jgi:hypothetical protein
MIHNSTSGQIPKRTESSDSKIYLYDHIYSSQKMEATQVFINR